ncbi:PREDICTED: protein patched-like [Trachymyrmex septentrionalis]|uniref:protein patched-like n=1 Tax=Trachymyrmex septentrionalis TaxID=34720 RepID=UPI00084EE7EA|nr:PREDICTED: protein patched-like [Trachymyrmex septentrionalis]
MVSVSGPISTGILAGRLSGSPGSRQNSDAEGEKDLKAAERTRIRHESDLYVRPSWTDAAIALDQLEKGKADGQRSAVWFRARLQDQLSQLGYFLQRHAGKVLFVAVLALAILCVALKSAQVNSKVEQLWVQEDFPSEFSLLYMSMNSVRTIIR